MLGTYGLVRASGPASEILSLAEAKAHVRVEHAADDDYIMALVRAATQRIEEDFGICMVSIGWTLTLDGFPSGGEGIELPRSPLASVSGVSYVDGDGGTVTMAEGDDYEVPAGRRLPVIVPAEGGSWPATKLVSDAVTVMFTAGFGTAESVPDPLKQAVRMSLGHWYRNRESVVVGAVATPLPQAVEWLVAPWWPGRYA